MKRFFAGMLSLLGIIAALVGAAAKYLPVDSIVYNVPWLGFITNILVLEPYWLYITAGGALMALAFGVLYILQRRDENAESDAASSQSRQNQSNHSNQMDQINQMYQADNADIRARVRDLLHRAWGGPLLALILGLLPVTAVHAGVHIFLRPFQTIWTAVYAVFSEYITLMGGWKPAAILIATGSLPDLSSIADACVKALPGIGILLLAWAFVFQPMRVSRAGYFMQLLYGKKPSPLSAFACFKNKYIRAVGGMAYSALWLTIWGLLTLAIPVGTYAGGLHIINTYSEELFSYVLWLTPTLVGVTAVSFVAFAWRFVDRLLAYSFVPCVLASQKALPARRAMRASRYLTRGHKTRLLAMWLSFMYYFLPTVGALALMPLIAPLGQVFGFTEYLSVTLRRFFLILIGANQLLWLYVGPLAWASFYAFYLEMKREYRELHPTRLYILGILPKEPMPYKSDEKTSGKDVEKDSEKEDLDVSLQRKRRSTIMLDVEAEDSDVKKEA
ncbi:hypothetical protein AGMMS49992_22590 [Clostridia bacterium]|nr:hypothetical protein AGMMS49992_22590 [Clostridia bacterium]